MHKAPTNPFTFGDLALDDAFTDREDEIRELTADIRNGQNVLVYAPRRYGKSSLVLRAAQEAMRRKVLVGYCDLMRTPTKERFAAALAKTIYADIASPDRAGVRACGRALPWAPRDADDRGRPERRQPPVHVPDGPAANRHRRHDRAAARARRRARRRAQAARGDHLRRVPGDPRARPSVPEPDARGLPGAARGQPRLPRQQAAPAGAHLQRPERAVLAQRQAARDRDDPPGEVRSVPPRAVRRLRQVDRRRAARTAPRCDRRTPVRDPGARLLHVGARPPPAAAPPSTTSRKR